MRTHGRYSTLTHTRLRDLIAEHEADPDPLNILPELAAARALFQDFIDRYDTFADAIVAWHDSWEVTRAPLPEDKIMALETVVDEWENQLAQLGENATQRQQADMRTARAFIDLLRGRAESTGRPRQVLDIGDAYRIVAEVTKIVERIEKIRAANAISRKDFIRLTDLMGRAVLKHVSDPAILKAIRDEWLSLAV